MIAIDVTVASAPIKNIVSQLPFSISPYFPVIAISSLIVFLEKHFGVIRQEIKKGIQDENISENTQTEVLNLVKYFIFIIPSLVVYEGVMQCVNHYELGSPLMSYVSTLVKYFALASLSFTTHRILFLYAHKIDFDAKSTEKKINT